MLKVSAYFNLCCKRNHVLKTYSRHATTSFDLSKYQESIAAKLRYKLVPEHAIAKLLDLPYEIPVNRETQGLTEEDNERRLMQRHMLTPSFKLHESTSEEYGSNKEQTLIFETNYTGLCNRGFETYINIDIYNKDNKDLFHLTVEWTLADMSFESGGLNKLNYVDTDVITIKKVHSFSHDIMPQMSYALEEKTFADIEDGDFEYDDDEQKKFLRDFFVTYLETEIRSGFGREYVPANTAD